MTGGDCLDAVVIGGGFYGAAIAVYLAERRGLERVVVVEQDPGLLGRASYSNQARVHGGYHYPRSFTTAYRSRVNLPRFLRDWPDTVTSDFSNIYVVARRNSKVTSRQFIRFCQSVGARLEPAGRSIEALFEPRLVEAAFRVEEPVFDASKLAGWARMALREHGVEVRLQTRATAVFRETDGALRVALSRFGAESSERSRFVFNCTYSGLNQLGGDFPGTRMKLKHEIAEMGLMEMPPALKNLGVTVMDGAYFSTMPFPAEDCHTLSHVRYTPHLHWLGEQGVNPYQRMARYDCATRVPRMVRDAARYLPAILDARQRGSLFEVKTVLVRSEADDGRPILFEKHPELPGCFSILGGKVDNVFDVLEKLDTERLSWARTR